jgi:hypothetical protein
MWQARLGMATIGAVSRGAAWQAMSGEARLGRVRHVVARRAKAGEAGLGQVLRVDTRRGPAGLVGHGEAKQFEVSLGGVWQVSAGEAVQVMARPRETWNGPSLQDWLGVLGWERYCRARPGRQARVRRRCGASLRGDAFFHCEVALE